MLFNLSRESIDFANVLEQMDEDPEVVAALIDTYKDEISDKLEEAAKYHIEQSSLSEVLKSREKAIKERRSRAESKAEAIKKSMLTIMKALDLSEIVTNDVEIKLANKAPTVEIVDEDKIPGWYLAETVVPTARVDKALLLLDLKAGKEVAGAKLIKDKRISIK